MQSTFNFTDNGEPNLIKIMDDTVFEQICDAIFMLIPEGNRPRTFLVRTCIFLSKQA